MVVPEGVDGAGAAVFAALDGDVDFCEVGAGGGVGGDGDLDELIRQTFAVPVGREHVRLVRRGDKGFCGVDEEKRHGFVGAGAGQLDQPTPMRVGGVPQAQLGVGGDIQLAVQHQVAEGAVAFPQRRLVFADKEEQVDCAPGADIHELGKAFRVAAGIGVGEVEMGAQGLPDGLEGGLQAFGLPARADVETGAVLPRQHAQDKQLRRAHAGNNLSCGRADNAVENITSTARQLVVGGQGVWAEVPAGALGFRHSPVQGSAVPVHACGDGHG